MPRTIAKHGGVVTLLSLILALLLLLPAIWAPQTIEAQGSELYILVQIPDNEDVLSLKAAVEKVFDCTGVYAIVGCSQAQLANLESRGFMVEGQCIGEEDECVSQLVAMMKSLTLTVGVAPPVNGQSNFGYQVIDSNQSGGPCFNWIDITETGTNTGINCDDCSATVPIGFPFEFYGNTYTNISISSNGFLAFDDEWASACWHHCIPNTNPPDNIICPFWDDLYSICEGSAIYYDTYDTRLIGSQRAFVVEWVGNQFCCGCPQPYRLTFEAILYERSDSILFQYLDMTGGPRADGIYALIGIENSDGTDGLQYSCDSPAIYNELAILFYMPPLEPNFNCIPAEPPTGPSVSPSVTKYLSASNLSLQYFSINPERTTANQPVTITTNVVNTGDEAGNLNIALKINGQVEETKMVSVGPQATQPVKFTVSKSQPGTYDVDIGGQKGSFIILGDDSTAGAPVNGGLIALIIIGVLVLATVMVLLISRRPA